MFEDCLLLADGLYDFIVEQKRLVEILLLIVMPLGWGLGVEYFFRWFRGRRLGGGKRESQQ